MRHTEPPTIEEDIHMDLPPEGPSPTITVNDDPLDPVGPGIPGPTSDSCMYGPLIRVPIALPGRDDPPIHQNTSQSWTEMSKITGEDTDYGLDFEKKKRKKGKGKKGLHLYWSNASNMVFAGSTARAAAQAALDDREFTIDYKTGVYHAAQQGLPMNPIEVDKLIKDDTMMHLINQTSFHLGQWPLGATLELDSALNAYILHPLNAARPPWGSKYDPWACFDYRHACLVLAPGASANLTLDTVAEVLIHNGVNPREIDHSYTFGVNYLDQIYVDDPIHRSLFDVADDHYLHALQLHGVPPAIPEFDGWTLPSEIDLIQMYYFESRIHSEENHEIMDVSGWKITSGSLYKSLGPAAPFSSLNPNIAGSSSLAPGNGFAAIKQEAPPLDEMVEPDSLPLDNEPVDIDAPELTSMMVDMLPYGEASPTTAGHTTPEPQSTSEDISSS
ncbi:hypothetical protein P691DRAFT_783242, partial [Macrolepiota fuliginosa MF-IS2]